MGSTVATFQGPRTHTSESTVTSASAAGLVASVPWPALRSMLYSRQISRATVAYALGWKFCDSFSS